MTGGALNFALKTRLRDVFRKGLIKAALSTSAWISSGFINIFSISVQRTLFDRDFLEGNKIVDRYIRYSKFCI